MTTIANGVPMSERQDRRDWDGRILSLARWHPMKGHSVLFEAIRIARDRGLAITVTCAGTGMDATNGELRTLIDAHGVGNQVELLGPVSDPRSLFPSHDLLAITSSYGEALPMAGLEAISVGMPVLTTDVGDSAKLAASPALVAKPGSAEGIVGGLVAYAGMTPEERKALSKSSHDIAAESFSIEYAAKQYANVYEQILVNR